MQATSQARVEELLSRFPGIVRRGDRCAPEAPGITEARIPTGHPEIDDLLGGGLPRGRLSELVGRGSTGITSLVQRLLAKVTSEERFAAWVDLADAFDPASASAAGVVLQRLLWVRPPDPIAAFAATEILLATGGFALVLFDAGDGRGADESGHGRKASGLASRPPLGSKGGRRMLTAPQTWLRLARAAAKSQTALVVLPGAAFARTGAEARAVSRATPRFRRGAPEGGGLAGAAAGVRLEFSSVQAVWEGAPGAPALLEGLVTRVAVTRNRGGRGGPPESRRTHIRLA